MAGAEPMLEPRHSEGPDNDSLEDSVPSLMGSDEGSAPSTHRQGYSGLEAKVCIS